MNLSFGLFGLQGKGEPISALFMVDMLEVVSFCEVGKSQSSVQWQRLRRYGFCFSTGLTSVVF